MFCRAMLGRWRYYIDRRTRPFSLGENLIEFATSLAYSFIVALPKCHIIVGANWSLKAKITGSARPITIQGIDCHWK
jgi:hypothetical protein